MKKFVFILLILAAPLTCLAQSSKIKVSELPKDAQVFLKQFYKNRPVASVYKRDELPAAYEVRLAQGTAIKFGTNGEWREVDGDGSSLPKTLIPAPIAEFIEANYPKKRVTFIEKDARGIAVNLNGKIALAFDSKGRPRKS